MVIMFFGFPGGLYFYMVFFLYHFFALRFLVFFCTDILFHYLFMFFLLRFFMYSMETRTFEDTNFS